MTKEEAAQKFVDMLTEQQCRQMLAPVLIAICPRVFEVVEKSTSPRTSISVDFNELRNAMVEHDKETKKIVRSFYCQERQFIHKQLTKKEKQHEHNN